MALVIQPGFLRNILELAAPQIVKEHVPKLHRRYKQVGQAVVVHVGECRPRAHLALHAHAGAFGDVRKLAVAQVAPKLALAQLVHEINIQQAIPKHIRHRQAHAVIVMHGFKGPAGITHHMASKRDAALRHPVGELEVIKCVELFGRLLLLLFAILQQFQRLREALQRLRQDRRGRQDQPARAHGHKHASPESVPAGFNNKKSFHKTRVGNLRVKLGHTAWGQSRQRNIPAVARRPGGRSNDGRNQGLGTKTGRQRMRAQLRLEPASLPAGAVPKCAPTRPFSFVGSAIAINMHTAC